MELDRVEAEPLGQGQRLADPDHRDAQDHVVADLGRLSGPVVAGPDGGPGHGGDDPLHLGEVGFVARYGGEEFAVVFAGLAAAAAIPHGEKARLAIGTSGIKAGTRDLRVTASGGVAEIMAGDTEKEVIGRADEALYASKNGGRNCGHHNDGRMNHLIKLQQPAIVATSPVSERLGDEWLEDDVPTEELFQEAIPNVSSRPAFFDDLKAITRS